MATPRAVGGLLLGALLVGCTAENAGTRIVRGDSSGVAFVHYPAVPDSGLARWSTRTLFSTRNHDSLRIWTTAAALFLPDSSVLIGNGADLLALSADGRTVRRLGRRGEGPGEYVTIWRLSVAADGTILVGDLSGRITHLAPDGRVLRIVPRLAPGPAGREVDPIGLLPGGRMVATWWQGRPNRGAIAGLPHGGVERDPVPLLVFDSAGAPVDSLAVWLGLERARVTVEGSESRLPIPYARSAVYDARGEFLAIGTTDSLDVTLYRAMRPVLRVTAGGRSPVPAGALLDTWRAAVIEEYPDLGETIVEALEGAPVAARLPMVGAVVVDDGGNVWVGAYRVPGAGERPWLVVSPSGEALGVVELPAVVDPFIPGRSEILDVFGDRLALLRVTEAGEPYVEVRAVEKG